MWGAAHYPIWRVRASDSTYHRCLKIENMTFCKISIFGNQHIDVGEKVLFFVMFHEARVQIFAFAYINALMPGHIGIWPRKDIHACAFNFFSLDKFR